MMNSPAVVLDSGSGYIKLGWADQTFPFTTYPGIVGRPMLTKQKKVMGIEIKDVMVGNDAAQISNFLDISYPTTNGKITNWADQKLVWKYGFDQMDVKPAKSRILVTEPVKSPDQCREDICQHIFETFHFDKFFLQVQALLALMGEGRETATILDSGDGVTHIIPVVGGNVLAHLIKRIDMAGRYVTKRLGELLFLRGYAFNSGADFELVREIKERCCMVSHDITVDRKLASETTCHDMEYVLPDGQLVKLGRERFEGPEVLFNPRIANLELPGLGESVFETIKKSEHTVRKDLFETILLTGGTTMLPGFSTRLETEMDKYYRNYVKKGEDDELAIEMNIIDPPRRRFNVFIGGGFYCQLLDSKPDNWITSKEYKEKGAKRLMAEKKGFST